MALSIFADALPYTEMKSNYINWIDGMQLAELQPNIGYSSSLHWQLYCDKYPDDRNIFVDWGRVSERNRVVCTVAKILRPFDNGGNITVFIKKLLDRVIFRRNAFANIPFKFREDFSEIGKYLFWDKDTYTKEEMFDGYKVISQDEGHISFDIATKRLEHEINNGEKNIMFVTGFADALGHKTRRGAVYSERLVPYMKRLGNLIKLYHEKNPSEDVLLVSDHGMSTIKKRLDLGLEKKFGEQSQKTYIAYSDSCIMCIWSDDVILINKIQDYLKTRNEGHLLSSNERKYYNVTKKQFGNLIYILREGVCFANSWFGKSLKRPSFDGEGMHGFWPEKTAKDQMASIVLLSQEKKLKDFYVYAEAYKLIKEVMQG